MAKRHPHEGCIYCGGNAANAKEHWILRGIGTFKGYSPLLDRLCEPCNQILGRTIDEQFCRTGPAATFRQALGIRGRHDGRPVNPLHYRASEVEPPSRIRAWVPSGEHQMLVEPVRHGDTFYVRPLRQIIVRSSSGELVPVQFPTAWDARILREALERKGLGGATIVALYSDPDEREAALPILKDLFSPFDIPCYKRTVPVGAEASIGEVQPVLASWHFGDEYCRAVAKMAFHYLLKFCPFMTGREEGFKPVREFVRHGEGNVLDFVRITRDAFSATHWGHTFLVRTGSSGIQASLQFFVAPRIHGPIWAVNLLGRSVPCRFTEWRAGHQMVFFEEKREGHDGEIVEIGDVPDHWFNWDRSIQPPST